jgi:tRNA (guanine37-N1)-methyltransferase
MDACIRLLPGVISKPCVHSEESFSAENNNFAGLLEYPHYTRPAIWKDKQVPEVLLSGHHAAIQKWRLQQAQAITKLRRPDMWQRYCSVHAVKDSE